MLSVINRISERCVELLSTDDFLVIDALYREQPLTGKMQSRLNRVTEMGIVEHVGRKKQVLPGHNRNQIQVLMRELRDAGKVFCKGNTSAAKWFTRE